MPKDLLGELREIEAAREKLKAPGFMTGLFAGKPDFSLITPFPEQSPEDKKIGDKFCKKVEEFLHAHVDPAEIERNAKIPDEVLKGLFELGAFGMKIPKEYGGLGFSQTNYNRVLTLVASWCNVLALTLSAHQSIGVSTPILLFGNEEQKRKYLPRVAQKELSGFALTEPSVGSDPASMKIEAVLNAERTHYVLNGQKLWCTNGCVAGVIVLMARVPAKRAKDASGNKTYVPVPEGEGADKKVITAFIVEMNTPGIEILHRCQFEGCRGIENALVGFKNVKIPVENVIGEVGKGLKYALTVLNTGRASINAICLGMAKRAWLPTLEWANFRKTFGKPLGQHEAQTMRIARMASNLFAMEAATWLASQLIDRKGSDVRIEAALTKVFCSEANIQFMKDAQIIFGGRGYETADSKRARGEPPVPVEQWVRDAELYRIGEGATDILIPFIAREALDPHLENAKDFIEGKFHGIQKLREMLRLANFYVRWWLKQWLPSTLPKGIKNPKLQKHLRYVENTSRRLARAILYAMLKHRAALRDRQGVIARITQIGIDLFMIAATASYADYLERTHHRPEAWDLADQFFRDAQKRIEGTGYFAGIKSNDDAKTRAVGLKALDGLYNWLSDGAMVAEETQTEASGSVVATFRRLLDAC